MMTKWTAFEFDCLKQRLTEQDMGYKVINLSPKNYSIVRQVGDKTHTVAEYNSETEELKSFGLYSE